MKKMLGVMAAAIVCLGIVRPAGAANWFELAGNENPGAKPVRMFGFVQPTYMRNQGGGVSGLAGPGPAGSGIKAYEGQTALFNRVAPDYDNSEQLQVLRADFGLRGVVPGTDERINYLLLTEFGNNGLTLDDGLVTTDASVTFNYIPGARVRVGLQRAPLGEEALQAIQVFDYVNFSNVTDYLLLERFVEPYVTARTTAAPAGLANAKIVGAVGGFRDVGVQVYDWVRRDGWEYAYSVMAGTGSGISFSDNDSNLDVSARVQAGYVFGGEGARREDVVGYIWHQTGKRSFAGVDYERMRQGAGFKYAKQPFRLAGEFIRAKGMIFSAVNPPFKDLGSGMEPAATVALDSGNKAEGWYLDAGWSITPKWEADLRYDELDNLTNSAANERLYTTWTFGLQHFFRPNLRVALNYEVRELKIVDPSAITAGPQRTNAQAIADSIGDRISAQLTLLF